MTTAMELQQSHPNDLIERSWLDSYEQKIEFLWWQLVRLNSNIYLLDKIYAFPFHLFGTQPRHFWNLVQDALVETCILIAYRVVADDDPQSLGLRRFKNQVFKHIRNEDDRIQLELIFREARLEERISNLEPTIRSIRNNFIAHFNAEMILNPTEGSIEQRKLLFADLKQFRDGLNSYFGFLCFGHQRALVLWGYPFNSARPADPDRRTDVERLLDSLARGSSILNLPEKDLPRWLGIRKTLSEQDLDVYNQYRVKFGLSKA